MKPNKNFNASKDPFDEEALSEEDQSMFEKDDEILKEYKNIECERAERWANGGFDFSHDDL